MTKREKYEWIEHEIIMAEIRQDTILKQLFRTTPIYKRTDIRYRLKMKLKHMIRNTVKAVQYAAISIVAAVALQIIIAGVIAFGSLI